MQKYFYMLFLVSSCLFGMEEDKLACAIAKGKVQLCTTLWQQGATIKPEHLISAVDKGYDDVVAFLVSADEDLIQKTNESIKKKDYCSKINYRCYSALVDMALYQKNAKMLRLFVSSADESHLKDVASEGWSEGLAILLEHVDSPSKECLCKVFWAALYSGVIDCCKQLIKRGVLKHKNPTSYFTNSPLGPQACKLLLNIGASRLPRLGVNDIYTISPLHTIIDYTVPAYADDSCGRPRIEWLKSWIDEYLHGKEPEEVDKKDEKKYPYDERNAKYMKTFFVLMTHPTKDTVEEHKAEIKKLLQLRSRPALNSSFDPHTAYQLAGWRGKCSMFQELLNPDKVAQWYPAIERAYKQRDAQ